MKIAVTGAGGFIGRRLVQHLCEHAHEVRIIARHELSEPDFSGVECVIHCAGIAHRSGSNAASPAEMDAVNHRLALVLAEQARAAGVKRFIFVSTINVVAGHPPPLTADLSYHPLSDYGHTKALAEQGLLKMQGIEIGIARPALVYGAGAPGNLRLLLKLCDSVLPLPFGSANNQRSFVSLSNVVRALEFMARADRVQIDHRIFHLADPVALSTKQLVMMLRQAMGRANRMVPVPRRLMQAGLIPLGKKAMYEQLYEDLIIDGSDLEMAGFAYSDGQPDMTAMADTYIIKKAG
ncbi:MAG TPA: NAD-dependent epimerase/dehydratase family protein [Pseudochrobactrum sp.]|nr:NAD-dependent epimerase/dehydratase family protein [Pseudochrobactrum sp.]